MGIAYLDYYLPDTQVPIHDLIELEKKFDHAAARDRIHAHGQQFEGTPASQLFGIESSAALFRLYRDTDKLERDIRTLWNISHARVENSLSVTAVFRILLDRFFAHSSAVRPEQIDHLIYCSYNQNIHEMDRTCIPYALQDYYGMGRCTTTVLFRDCASVMAAIEFAEGLLGMHRAEHCLILCANVVERMPRLLDFTVVSDSVGLAHLSANAPLEVLDHRSSSRGTRRGTLDLGILQVAQEGSRLIRSLLDDHGLTLDDVDRIITNNTNEVIYREVYARLLGVPAEKLLSGNTADGGHCGNVDMLRNLKDLCDDGASATDGHLLLYNAGGTDRYHTWNLALLRRRSA